MDHNVGDASSGAPPHLRQPARGRRGARKAIPVQLGHASAEMTLNRYSHLYPGELDALAAHLDASRNTSDVGRRLTLFDDRHRHSRRR